MIEEVKYLHLNGQSHDDLLVLIYIYMDMYF